MGWGEAIKSFLTVLPQLFQAFQALAKVVQEKNFQDWVSELSETTKDLEKASTLRERVDAAKRLSDLFNRM